MPPKFISFEGIDGSGKSTQMKLFSDRLNEHGIEHLLSREPGGSKGAGNGVLKTLGWFLLATAVVVVVVLQVI